MVKSFPALDMVNKLTCSETEPLIANTVEQKHIIGMRISDITHDSRVVVQAILPVYQGEELLYPDAILGSFVEQKPPFDTYLPDDFLSADPPYYCDDSLEIRSIEVCQLVQGDSVKGRLTVPAGEPRPLYD